MKFKIVFLQIFIITLTFVLSTNLKPKSNIYRVKIMYKSNSFMQLSSRNTTNSTTSNNHVQSLPGIFPDNTTFLINANFEMKNKASYAKHTKCKNMQGLLYLLMVDEIIDHNDPSKHHRGLTAKPSFISLNEHAFSVQATEAPPTLIKAILLEKILRVTQTYPGTTCFDIVEEKKELTPLQLCSETKDEMDEWIVGILEFKECLLKEKFELIDANANAFATNTPKPNKDDIKSGKGTVPQKVSPPVFSPFSNVETPVKPVVVPDALFYVNSFAPTSEVQEITETDATLTKILNNKKREELAQRQIKRQMEDKLRKVKEASKKIELQIHKQARAAAANKRKEIAIATQKIEESAQKQEKNILNNALKNMNNMNVIIFINVLIICMILFTLTYILETRPCHIQDYN